MSSIAEIKAEFKNMEVFGYNELISTYENDEREGVQKIICSAKKKLTAYEEEINRTHRMYEYERKYSSEYKYICGIDEVGRGPLAGPVVTAAVILPADHEILYLNDSKQLSAKKRQELFEKIMQQAVAVGIGMSDEKRIDEINILNANYEAMRMAISKLGIKPDLLLNDAVTIPEVDIPQIPIIKGDTLSASIAAASIVAKVTRDRLMVEWDTEYPQYDFAGNKGYGSAKHIEALKQYGPCPIHRRSFITHFV